MTASLDSTNFSDATRRKNRAGKGAASVRVFNLRLALGTLLAVAILGPAVYAWHTYQIHRTARAFLQRADALEADREWLAAATYLHRYLSLHPDDNAVRLRMVKTLDEGAKNGPQKVAAINLYYQTLGLVPQDERPALRRRLAELLLQMRRFAAAESEAAKVLAVDPKDAQAQRLLALALYGEVQSGAALSRPKDSPPISQTFESALQGNPGDIQLSSCLARIYRDEKQPLAGDKRALLPTARAAEADRLIEQMIRANPDSADAYLARHAYRAQYRLPGGEEDIRLALKYGPDRRDVLLAAVTSVLQNQKGDGKAAMQEARALCQRVLQVAPNDERGYVLLGEIDWSGGDRTAALQTWRRGLKEANKDSLPLQQCLAAALVTMRKADEAQEPLDALERILAGRAALLPGSDRARLESARDFLRGKWWLLKGDPGRAASLLKRVVAQPASGDSARSAEAWMLLARISAADEQWDQAAAAYEHAALLQPRSAAARLAAARAWAGAGRYDTAIRYGEQALAIDNASQTWLFLADARYRQQLALPEKRRDWQAFRKTFAEAAAAIAKQPLPEPWRLTVLQADSLLAGAADKSPEEANREAAALLRAAEKQASPSPALLQALLVAYQRAKCPADADRALAALEKLPDQSLPALLCRYQLCVLRRQYQPARDALEAGLKAMPAQTLPLRLALVGVSNTEGKPAQAYEELQRLEKDFPDHPLVLRQLAELASELGKNQESLRWEDKLREREGPEGLSWKYHRARRLLTEATGAADPRFLEAEKLAGELQAVRPSWPAAYLLLALSAQRRGNNAAAIDAYANAIRLGEQRSRVYEQLIGLLQAERRFAEAQEQLARLQDLAPPSENLSALEISLAIQSANLDRALAAARRGVESYRKSSMAQVRLGQVLLAMGKTREAEQALHAAAACQPADVRAYDALFDFYLRTDRPVMAAAIFAELEKQLALPPVERAFVLAQGYERLAAAGEESAKYAKQAGAQYAEAERLSPANVRVLERRAAFLLNRDPATAEQVLRRALAVDPHLPAARQMLAALLAGRGGEKEWQESQQMLAKSDGQASAAEQRLQASLLARRGGQENRARARRIIETLLADPKQRVADDYLFLAGLLEGEGKTDMARQQYLAVVGRADPAPAHLAQYVDFLLRHEASGEAKAWLTKLQEKRPEDFAVLTLRGRWLHAQHRDAEIEPEVEAVAEKFLKKLPQDARSRTPAEARLSQGVGDVYTGVGRHSAAERWYRRLRGLVPQQFAPLAVSLGRQNRLGEAIDACVEAEKIDHSARPAVVLAVVLSSNRPTAADFQRAEPLLSQALAKHPDDADLLNGIAGVRVLQQRNDAAIELYRRVAALKPKDVLALNNLATLLAEQPDTRQDAVRSIDEAIDTAGPLPALLDTKGTILVYAGKAEEAVPLLQEAAAGVNVDPRFLFHLSLACQRAGQADAARAALAKARAGKLAQQVLTPLESRLLQELEQKLGL